MGKRIKLMVIGIMSITLSALYGCKVSAKENKEVSLLFTHDLHSHLEPTELEDGRTMGGFARLKTLIDAEKRKRESTFIVDGGDFSMGTLYQTVYETNAAELVMLGRLGYDATTIGNHEFDYRGEGFAHMLRSAVSQAEQDEQIKLPALLSANIDWEKNHSKENQDVKSALDEYGSRGYIIIERGGVRVGLFGLMGKDSQNCAPESGIEFEDVIETSKRVVVELQKRNVDMIVCLSHSGTWEDSDKSEDEQLAQAVPEIDVIVSGHTHSVLSEPIMYGNTYVVSSGCYGTNVGQLQLVQEKNGRWKVEEYLLHPMDESVKPDAQAIAQIEEYKSIVEREYLSQFGYSYGQILAKNAVDFGEINEILSTRGETKLGNLIADAYIYAVKQAEGNDYREVDMAVVPSGIVRETLEQGEITVAEAFSVSSLGIGPDRIPGYPLVSIYLTGKEIMAAAEVDASISPMMDGTELFPSGIGWEYNPNRLLLNKVTDVWKITATGEQKPIQEDQLYRVVADLYSAQMLGAVKSKSFGLLSLEPKNEKGEVTDDFESYIICNKNDGSEVKEWVALANYLESFQQQGGVSTVPDKYEKIQKRKIINESKNPKDLLKNPNKIFFMVAVVVAVIMIALFFIVRAIKYFIKKAKISKM